MQSLVIRATTDPACFSLSLHSSFLSVGEPNFLVVPIFSPGVPLLTVILCDISTQQRGDFFFEVVLL